MVKTFTGKAKELWNTWDIRVFVLVSLFFQTVLIFAASLRKRNASAFLGSVIWLFYLAADWVAIFAIGLISKAQDASSPSSSCNPHQNYDLLVLWAPFLLLHLGGPDAITALALEDNTLWKRHLLQFCTQVGSTLYVFYQAFSTKKLWLWLVILFMSIAGTIKYAERTLSLYLASLDRFRDSLLTDPDPGPNYAKLMDEFSSRKEANLPTEFDLRAENEEGDFDFEAGNHDEGGDDDDHCKLEELDYVNMVQEAYGFFVRFRGLIVDLIFSFKERNDSRNFFLKFETKDAEKAFEIIEIELNFMHDIFYTKVVLKEQLHVLKDHLNIYYLRVPCLCLIIAALTVFEIKERRNYSGVEVVITYILIGGAIALDTYALFKLYLSEWTIATQREREKKTKDKWSAGYWLCELAIGIRCLLRRFPIKLRFLQRRWSETISQYNILDYCLREHPGGCMKCFYCIGCEDMITGCRYVKTKKYTSPMRDFIFEELRTKSKRAVSPEITKNICSARGNWVLPFSIFINLREWILDVDYDESLLLWHIATEILYNLERNANDEDDDMSCCVHCLTCYCFKKKTTWESNIKLDYAECSRIFSNYMVYLLLRQTTMMSAVADIAQIRFQDTCAEAKKFIARVGLESVDKKKRLKELCKKIKAVDTFIKPEEVKGDKSKSVLFDACRLAKELEKLEGDKWEMICKVWAELLSYAAIRCKPESHVQMLSKGGELISLVWLMMAHLGLGEQFRINKGTARAKLLVGK
ncbi:hypothetical protein Ancab_014921 [Ancistrocladus abbreviatus]